MNNAFGIPTMASGLIVAAALAGVIFGGVKRIGKVAEILVPFMQLPTLLSHL